MNRYVDGLQERGQSVRAGLDEAEFGTFELLDSALAFDYSAHLYDLRRIDGEYDGALSDEAAEVYDGLFESLQLFGVAREHFKTLYFQWELINLSRAVIFALVPSLIVSVSVLLFLDLQAVAGSTFGVDDRLVLVSAAVTVTAVPFLLLVTFLLRIGTMAKRTLAVGPFLLRETAEAE